MIETHKFFTLFQAKELVEMMQLRVVKACAYNRYAAIHSTNKDAALACRTQGRSAWLTIHVKRGSSSIMRFWVWIKVDVP